MPELGTTKQQRLNSVDADFQTRYVAAEQAYGAGDFQTAQAITSELMAELEPLLEAAEERDAALAWQAFVALLAGHIQLYGLQQTDQARAFYNLVLNSHPPDTLQELAEQGLERLAEQTTTQTIHTAEPETAQTSLIRDPFLSPAHNNSSRIAADANESAAPWLQSSTAAQPALTTSGWIQDLELNPESTEIQPLPEKEVAESGSPAPEDLQKRLLSGRLRVEL